MDNRDTISNKQKYFEPLNKQLLTKDIYNETDFGSPLMKNSKQKTKKRKVIDSSDTDLEKVMITRNQSKRKNENDMDNDTISNKRKYFEPLNKQVLTKDTYNETDSGSPLMKNSKRKKKKRKVIDSSDTDLEKVIIARKQSKRKNENCKSLYAASNLETKIPKVEDILRRRKENEEYEKNKVYIKNLHNVYLKRKNIELEREKKGNKKKIKLLKLLDCKQLTLDYLENCFKINKTYFDNIFYERCYNQRHEDFKKDNPMNNGTPSDLRYNESCEVFTKDQKVYIVGLFRKRYDKRNIYEHSDYYFKVLLPEYCLKIFMDFNNVDCDTAMNHLRQIPVPTHVLKMFQ